MEQLPVEIIEYILLDLSLDDIRHVRLTSRAVSGNASTGRFKTFCRTKDVNLRVPALCELSEMIVPGSVACGLQHLTITGVLYVTTSLEKELRTKTTPTDETDIFGQRKDALGNHTAARPARVPATAERLADTQHDLKILHFWKSDAAFDRASSRDLAALTEVFRRVREHGVLRGLESITLFVAVARSSKRRLAPKDGGGWRAIWNMAQHTLSTTVRALSSAELPVNRLDIFGYTNACSVSSYDITEALDTIPTEAKSTVLRELRSLTISVSPRTVPPSNYCEYVNEADPDNELQEHRFGSGRRAHMAAYSPPTPGEVERFAAMRDDEGDVTGLARLLSGMPFLEELDLHHYWYTSGSFQGDHRGGRLTLRNVVHLGNLRHLKKLTLRGLDVDVEDVLALLKMNPKLEEIDFRVISLNGLWQPIFAHITDPKNEFTRVNFDVLFDKEGRAGSAFMHFPAPAGGYDGRVQVPTCPSPSGWAAYTLEGREAVRKGISYRRSEHWVMGCVQHSMWRKERSELYGSTR